MTTPQPHPHGGTDSTQPHSTRRARWARWRQLSIRVAVETSIVAVLFALYNAGRLAIQGQEAVARSNADLVHELQHTLRFPSEAALQDAMSAVPHLFELANRYYVTFHFPVMIAFLLIGFLFRPHAHYTWARNLLATMTFLALAIHVAFPLAPPRMFPQWGFVDTMTVWGPSPYDGAAADIANQYAAMPSLHIGWALLIALVITRTGPRWLAATATLHAATTVFVVIVTANHWWIDGIIAAALLACALLFFPEPPGARDRDHPREHGHGTRTPAPGGRSR